MNTHNDQQGEEKKDMAASDADAIITVELVGGLTDPQATDVVDTTTNTAVVLAEEKEVEAKADVLLARQDVVIATAVVAAKDAIVRDAKDKLENWKRRHEWSEVTAPSLQTEPFFLELMAEYDTAMKTFRTAGQSLHSAQQSLHSNEQILVSRVRVQGIYSTCAISCHPIYKLHTIYYKVLTDVRKHPNSITNT